MKNRITYAYQIDNDGIVDHGFTTLEAARQAMRALLEESKPPDDAGAYEIFEVRTPKLSELLDLDEELVRARAAGQVVDELERMQPIFFDTSEGMERFVDAATAVLDTLFELCGGEVGAGIIDAGWRGEWSVDVVEVTCASVGPVPYAEVLDKPGVVRTARLLNETEHRLRPKVLDEDPPEQLDSDYATSAEQRPGAGMPPRTVFFFAGDEVPERGVQAALDALQPSPRPTASANFELQPLVVERDPLLKDKT